MTTVYLAVPPLEDHYPHAALRTGLQRIGYQFTPDWRRADVLVSWSDWLGSHRRTVAEYFRHEGKPIVIIERGWLSPIRGRSFYQVAMDGWNGAGRYCAGGPERWRSWGVRLKPWFAAPLGYALVIGQRGHKDDIRTTPPGWHETLPLPALNVHRRARDCPMPFEKHLAGAREVHVWTSNAASWAVVNGIPVFQYGPQLAVSELASRDVEAYAMPEREPVFERLAWMQWSTDELQSGEAFAWLLGERVR